MRVNIVERKGSDEPYVFTDLALCLQDLFRKAGHRVTYSINDVPKTGVSVILGWTPNWLKANNIEKHSVILLNAEQAHSDSKMVDEEYENILKTWYIAEYHKKNTTLEKNYSLIPIKPTKAVRYDVPRDNKDIDILFYGSMNDRRRSVLDKIREKGLKVEVVGKFGKNLAPYIVRSHIVLNIHYYETALFPIIRFLQPIEQRIPIICENSKMSPHNDWSKSGIKFVSYDAIPDECVKLFADKKEQFRMAMNTLKFSNALDTTPQINKLLDDYLMWSV
jgi:hypothetical protein